MIRSKMMSRPRCTVRARPVSSGRSSTTTRFTRLPRLPRLHMSTDSPGRRHLGRPNLADLSLLHGLRPAKPAKEASKSAKNALPNRGSVNAGSSARKKRPRSADDYDPSPPVRMRELDLEEDLTPTFDIPRTESTQLQIPFLADIGESGFRLTQSIETTAKAARNKPLSALAHTPWQSLGAANAPGARKAERRRRPPLELVRQSHAPSAVTNRSARAPLHRSKPTALPTPPPSDRQPGHAFGDKVAQMHSDLTRRSKPIPKAKAVRTNRPPLSFTSSPPVRTPNATRSLTPLPRYDIPLPKSKRARFSFSTSRKARALDFAEDPLSMHAFEFDVDRVFADDSRAIDHTVSSETASGRHDEMTEDADRGGGGFEMEVDYGDHVSPTERLRNRSRSVVQRAEDFAVREDGRQRSGLSVPDPFRLRWPENASAEAVAARPSQQKDDELPFLDAFRPDHLRHLDEAVSSTPLPLSPLPRALDYPLIPSSEPEEDENELPPGGQPMRSLSSSSAASAPKATATSHTETDIPYEALSTARMVTDGVDVDDSFLIDEDALIAAQLFGSLGGDAGSEPDDEGYGTPLQLEDSLVLFDEYEPAGPTLRDEEPTEPIIEWEQQHNALGSTSARSYGRMRAHALSQPAPPGNDFSFRGGFREALRTYDAGR